MGDSAAGLEGKEEAGVKKEYVDENDTDTEDEDLPADVKETIGEKVKEWTNEKEFSHLFKKNDSTC